LTPTCALRGLTADYRQAMRSKTAVKGPVPLAGCGAAPHGFVFIFTHPHKIDYCKNIVYTTRMNNYLAFFKKHVKKLLTLATLVVGCYLFFATAFVVVALAMDGRRASNLVLPDLPSTWVDTNGYRPEFPGFATPPPHMNDDHDDDGGILRPASRTNFLLLGIDQNALADAIMVGTFYRDTGDIHLMSIPRDTYVVLSNERHAQLQLLGLRIPQRLKINGLRSHGGRAWGAQLITEEIEGMFGITIDYYVEVGLGAFRRVVDNILGGIYFTVPRRMFYEDPVASPPLRIDLQPGFQRLNGVQAEGLVRYRGFADGDLGRNRTQMEFMTELVQQVTTREALMADPMELLRIFTNEVSTDFGPTSLLRFINYVPPLGTLGEIRTFVMPGAEGRRNMPVGGRILGQSVFIPNMNLLHEVADDVFRANIVREAPPLTNEYAPAYQ